MKNKTIWILGIVLVVLLMIATVGYRLLSSRYEPEPPSIHSAPESGAGSSMESGAGTAATAELLPDFTVLNAEGEAVNLHSYFGKPVVINFWATWCGPCKSEMPAFDTAYAVYGEDVNFLMVNMTDGVQETMDGVTAFLEETGYAFPVYYDTEYDAAMTYGVYSLPATLFINADGTLQNAHTGAMSEDTLNKYMEALIGGTEQ